MELVTAGQHPEQLAVLEVAHADDAVALVHARALDVAVVSVGRQLLDLALGQAARLRLAETLRQVQQRLCHTSNMFSMF